MRWDVVGLSSVLLGCPSPVMPETAQPDDSGLRQLTELPVDFPSGWFDVDDGRVLRLSPSRDRFAFLDGREVKPRFVHAPFELSDAGTIWTASSTEFMACPLGPQEQGARLVTEQVDLAPLEGGGWRLEMRVVSAAPCTKVKPELVVTALHTEHVLTPIIDPHRTSSLEATLTEANATDACPKLAKCCRSLRRHRVPGSALELCTRKPVFPIECHDLRAKLGDVVDAGACIQ